MFGCGKSRPLTGKGADGWVLGSWIICLRKTIYIKCEPALPHTSAKSVYDSLIES